MSRARVEQHREESRLRQQQLWAETRAREAARREEEQRRLEEAKNVPPPPLERIETMPPVPEGLDAIDIFSVNDMHRQLEPTHGGNRGGMARLVGTMKSLMKEYPHAIVVNLGDVAYDATNLSSFEPMPQLLKAMGTSILQLGNHEFQDPTNDYAALKTGLLQKFSGDVLAANVVTARDNQPIPGVKPFTVKQLCGYNVAFVGVVTQDMATAAHPAVGAGLRVAAIDKTLERLVPQVQQQADAVVVTAHEGLDIMDRQAAKQEGIDTILAAHDHLLTRKPRMVGDTPMTEAGSHGKYVGHTRLLMDPKTRHAVAVQYRVIPIDERSPVDAETEAFLAGH